MYAVLMPRKQRNPALNAGHETSLSLAERTTGARTMVRDASDPRPEPPMLLDSTAMRVWHALWDTLDGFLQPSDMFAMARYCKCIAHIEHLEDVIEENGWEDAQGRRSGTSSTWNDLQKLASQLESVIGLSPEARLRLGAAPVEAKDDLGDFLSEAS